MCDACSPNAGRINPHRSVGPGPGPGPGPGGRRASRFQACLRSEQGRWSDPSSSAWWHTSPPSTLSKPPHLYLFGGTSVEILGDPGRVIQRLTHGDWTSLTCVMKRLVSLRPPHVLFGGRTGFYLRVKAEQETSYPAAENPAGREVEPHLCCQ